MEKDFSAEKDFIKKKIQLHMSKQCVSSSEDQDFF